MPTWMTINKCDQCPEKISNWLKFLSITSCRPAMVLRQKIPHHLLKVTNTDSSRVCLVFPQTSILRACYQKSSEMKCKQHRNPPLVATGISPDNFNSTCTLSILRLSSSLSCALFKINQLVNVCLFTTSFQAEQLIPTHGTMPGIKWLL